MAVAYATAFFRALSAAQKHYIRTRRRMNYPMAKSLFIAEKPSVAMEFSKALKENMTRHDGYQESEHIIVTWCVGHLVTMSYPEKYDEKYRRWSLDTLPFIPEKFLYEVIPGVKKQFEIVKTLLNRADVETIYVCTDSGREGEYIYRLVAQMAGVKGKHEKRVWIDSQTEEEILHGIKTAKDLSAYDHLGEAAYLRAREDYLMGINFSRLLTLRYGNSISSFLGEQRTVISVGRVMTCVLGMVVRREREIRSFVKTPFYRVIASMDLQEHGIDAEFRAVEGSAWFGSPKLYKENGFKNREDAQQLIETLQNTQPFQAVVDQISRKNEKKNPPLLYNLAELQNDCSRMYKISPDQTLQIAQELYEKKLTTYPRTDARVLSSAVAKVIRNNLSGLKNLEGAGAVAQEILDGGSWKNISRTRYVNDSQITDHYAIIPTGQGLSALRSLSPQSRNVYFAIVRRFLGIFLPPAQYRKISLTAAIGNEKFFANFKVLTEPGYLKANGIGMPEKAEDGNGTDEVSVDMETLQLLEKLRKGSVLPVLGLRIREGETAPPKRYNSGSIILAMENAGQLIEDEELRSQIKGSGIGTSATRAEILKKLIANRYIALNKKTQILSPTQLGEMIFDVTEHSIRQLLNPELTASWEKGLTYVAEGTITPDEYMEKLRGFIIRRTETVMQLNNLTQMRSCYEQTAQYYQKKPAGSAGRKTGAAAKYKRNEKI